MTKRKNTKLKSAKKRSSSFPTSLKTLMVQERDLKDIAACLTHKVWKRLARTIGVKDRDIEDIEEKENDPSEKRYQMIRRWWDGQDQPLFWTLYSAAKGKLQNVQLAKKIQGVAQKTHLLASDDDSDTHTTDRKGLTKQFSIDEESEEYEEEVTEDFSEAESLKNQQTGTPKRLSIASTMPDSDTEVYQTSVMSTKKSVSLPLGSPPKLTEDARSNSAPNACKHENKDDESILENENNDKFERLSSEDVQWLTSDIQSNKICWILDQMNDKRAVFYVLFFVIILFELALCLKYFFSNSDCSIQVSSSRHSWQVKCVIRSLTRLVLPAFMIYAFLDFAHSRTKNAENFKTLETALLGSPTDNQKTFRKKFEYLRRRQEYSLRSTSHEYLISGLVYSIVKAAVTLFALYYSRLFQSTCDSWKVMNFVCSVVLFALSECTRSFYFNDMNLIYCMRSLRVYCSIKKKDETDLDRAIRKVEFCLNERWYKLELCFRSMALTYSILLLMNWSAGKSLTCFTSEALEANAWLYCVLLVISSHCLGTLWRFGWLQLLFPVAEAVIFAIIFNYHSISSAWMGSTGIFYAIVPMISTLHYLMTSIERQWVAINSSLGNATHLSRMLSRIALVVLIILSLCLTVHSEYYFVKDPSTLTTSCPLDGEDASRDTVQQVQSLASRVCNTVVIPSQRTHLLQEIFQSSQPCTFISAQVKETLSPVIAQLIELYDRLQGKL